MKEIPASVYRLQLSSKFPLKKATALIPYFSSLGIEGIYCSPLMQAFETGYDVTNPNQLNPALGTMKDFDEFCKELRKHKMVQVLDIVPHHMGIKGDKNTWWIDVLKNGPASKYSEFFDVNWKCEKPEIRDKVLLPILGSPYGEALKRGDFKLVWKDGFWVHYFDYCLPIRPACYERMKKKDIERLLTLYNENKTLLHELLEEQYYRLTYWKNAGQEINYRRFVNINDLIALHMEKEKVYKAYHRWIFTLLDTGKIQALRIDHPDGLYDPTQYFERICKKKPAFIWIEKILEYPETIPSDWDVEGTVGYDFLNIVSGVFIQKKSQREFTKIYEHFIEAPMVFEEVLYEKRKKYAAEEMKSIIDGLGLLVKKLAEKNPSTRDFNRKDLTDAVLSVIVCFPVYRTYIQPHKTIRESERKRVLLAIKEAKARSPEIEPSIFRFLQRLLLEDVVGSEEFLYRFQQATVPVIVKGLEDSTFYVYNRLISLNEVGGSPSLFGFSKSEFHRFNENRLKAWPLDALATSTHDSKFSGDARLRLNVLSEMPREWDDLVTSLKLENEKLKTRIKGRLFPDLNTEYYLYQMLIALWPATPKRLWLCLQKAIRQAGTHTSWRIVDERYEQAVKKFLDGFIKNPSTNFLQFERKVAKYGYHNSLSALVLKIGSCGIVHVYQGNERMQFRLMDPDNRVPVDFKSRKKALKNKSELKMNITAKGLCFRRDHKELFLKGEYIPLKSPDHVIAFMRVWKNQAAIILAGRYFGEKKRKGTVQLPKGFKPKLLRDIFTGKKILIKQNELSLPEVFSPHSFAILTTATS